MCTKSASCSATIQFSKGQTAPLHILNMVLIHNTNDHRSYIILNSFIISKEAIFLFRISKQQVY